MRGLYQQAQEGDEELLSYFREEWRMKIYTNEEVKALNTFLKKGRTTMEGEIIDVRERGLIILLPSLSGEEHPAQLNWIRQMEDDYYVAGLTYLGGDKDGGSTEWMLKRDDEVGFKPLFCTLYWD